MDANSVTIELNKYLKLGYYTSEDVMSPSRKRAMKSRVAFYLGRGIKEFHLYSDIPHMKPVLLAV